MNENEVKERVFGEQITIKLADGTENTWICEELAAQVGNANDYIAEISDDFIKIFQNVSNESKHGVGVWETIHLRESLTSIEVDCFSDGWDWIEDYETLPCIETLTDGTLIIRMFNLQSEDNGGCEEVCGKDNTF